MEWSKSKATGYNSADAFVNYEKVLAGGKKGKVTTINDGDFLTTKQEVWLVHLLMHFLH